MGRKSSFRYLPKELLEEIDRLLSEKRHTLAEILAHLQELGVDSVSRSALGRRKQRIDKVMDRMRESREMATIIAEKMGTEAMEGRHGRSLVQMLQTLTGEYMLRRMEDPEQEAEVKELMTLARTIKDAAQASRNSQDFELKIREQIEKEAKAKMAAAVEKVVGGTAGAKLDPAKLKEDLLAAYGVGA